MNELLDTSIHASSNLHPPTAAHPPAFYRPDDTSLNPWPDPVEPAALLDDIAAVLERFVVLPEWAPQALALWVLHTYSFHLRDITAYIGIESPEKRCGKTTLLTVLSELVYRPVVAANISSPAFFRVIEESRPTLLIDEADSFLQGNDELRGILNSGNSRKTAYVVRVNPAAQGVDDSQTRLARFSSWCPKVVAAIGRLPDTLADRCILIRMHRKIVAEHCERLRYLRTDDLRRRCLRFVADNANAIADATPSFPDALHDRACDTWEPLFALADLAGPSWSQSARDAALALTKAAEDTNPIASLLADIFVIFALSKTDRLFSRHLVRELAGNADRPWAELRKGKALTELWLAKQLRPYGVQPKTLRIGTSRAKGYDIDLFREAFLRYMPRAELDSLVQDS